MKLARKKENTKARIRCVVSFFVFCQANLILVPLPTHRRQVPPGMHALRTKFSLIIWWFGNFEKVWCCLSPVENRGSAPSL